MHNAVEVTKTNLTLWFKYNLLTSFFMEGNLTAKTTKTDFA